MIEEIVDITKKFELLIITLDRFLNIVSKGSRLKFKYFFKIIY